MHNTPGSAVIAAIIDSCVESSIAVSLIESYLECRTAATNVFEKQNGRWVLVHHHGGPIPPPPRVQQLGID